MSAWTAWFVVLDVWIASWVLAALWAARAIRRANFFRQAPNLAVTAVGVFLLAMRGRSDLAGPPLWRTPEPTAWAMVAMSVLGFAFCWWARLHLGALWSGTVTAKAGHRIIDTGPYRWVRHPIYTGILAAFLGLAIIDASAGGFVGLALMVLGFTMKARLEEGFLKTELGAAPYEAYAAATPMLFPWPRPNPRARIEVPRGGTTATKEK